MKSPGSPDDRVRLDRWLWAARQFKTRSLATRAVAGGTVRLNDRRVKPGTAVKVGDRIRVRKPPYELHLVVRALSESRGPAREAARLYEETPESRAAREMLALQLKHMPAPVYDGKGRPTKKDRRRIERLRRAEPEP
ncbi:MAG TPA: RNA-binding S4 domain-containing protein [Gemmatimonadota bacterium]|nr:RNA-binding S4 domain-containing protein [Gemmatimonadota bacterium]